MVQQRRIRRIYLMRLREPALKRSHQRRRRRLPPKVRCRHGAEQHRQPVLGAHDCLENPMYTRSAAWTVSAGVQTKIIVQGGRCADALTNAYNLGMNSGSGAVHAGMSCSAPVRLEAYCCGLCQQAADRCRVAS